MDVIWSHDQGYPASFRSLRGRNDENLSFVTSNIKPIIFLNFAHSFCDLLGGANGAAGTFETGWRLRWITQSMLDHRIKIASTAARQGSQIPASSKRSKKAANPKLTMLEKSRKKLFHGRFRLLPLSGVHHRTCLVNRT